MTSIRKIRYPGMPHGFFGWVWGVCDTCDTLGKNIMNVCYKFFAVDCQYSTGITCLTLSSRVAIFGSKISRRTALKCHSCETFYCTRSVGGGLVRGCKSNVWISPTRISWNSRGNDPIPLGAYLGSNWVGWNHQLAEYHLGAVVIHQIKIATLHILEHVFWGGKFRYNNINNISSLHGFPYRSFPGNPPDVHLLGFCFTSVLHWKAHGPALVLAEAMKPWLEMWKNCERERWKG